MLLLSQFLTSWKSAKRKTRKGRTKQRKTFFLQKLLNSPHLSWFSLFRLLEGMSLVRWLTQASHGCSRNSIEDWLIHGIWQKGATHEKNSRGNGLNITSAPQIWVPQGDTWYQIMSSRRPIFPMKETKKKQGRCTKEVNSSIFFLFFSSFLSHQWLHSQLNGTMSKEWFQ